MPPSFGQFILLAVLSSVFFLSLLSFAILRKTKKKLNPEEPHTKSEIPKVPEKIRENLKLPLYGKMQIFEEEFNQMKNDFLSKKQQFIEKYAPFFIEKEGKIKRIFPVQNQDPLLEKLYLFWKEGYRDGKLALTMLFYHEATQKQDLLPFLLKLLTLKKIHPEEKKLILFLYQNELQTEVPINDINFSISKSLIFSREYFSQKTKAISRRVYREIVGETLLKDNEEFMKEIYERATPALLLELYKKGSKHPLIKNLFFEQFLKSGKIHREEAWLLREKDSVLKIPENEEEFRDLLFKLAQKSPLSKALAFLILEKVQLQKRFRQLLSPDPEEIDHWKNQKSTLRPHLLYALFVLLSESGFHELALEFPVKIKNLKVELLKARNYYFSQKYQEALATIKELLEKYPENFYVLSDAAIYYFRLGYEEKAEELFQKLKTFYPNHPAVLHNEALFFEHKALKEIREKWAQVENSKVPA